MKVVAFAGPSVPPTDREAFAGIEWRPPAEAGDLLRLPFRRPLTVALIDGYFDHRPAVRHKEILLLLSQGVRVLGASSIGALRAAEMADFGMIGVGAIYRAYASGRISGDDEVALVHGPPEWGWRPISVPMVDVRATLCRAVRGRMLSVADARALLRAAAATHYTERSWDGLAGTIDWLARAQVDQKRIDARACLAAALAPQPAACPRPLMVRTVFVDALARECGAAVPASAPASRQSTRAARHSETGSGKEPIA